MNVRRLFAGRGPDAIVFGLLLAALLALFRPALTLDEPACYCDGPVESIPRLFAIARTVQAGGVPLWDPHTFAGGRPFYVVNESGVFYPPMYPFYAAADLASVEHTTFMLAMLPFVLHLLFTAAGAYGFARAVLAVPPLAAAVTAAVWTLSPEMSIQIMTPDGAYLFSYLPWILWAVSSFLMRPSVAAWTAGLAALALMTSVGTVNFVLRVDFVVAVSATLLWAMASWRDRRLRPGRYLAVVAMLVLASGLNGVPLSGVWTAVEWIRDAWTLTDEMAAGIMKESSMPPLNLVTLFVPNFFGVLDSAHGWGIALAEEMTNVSALAGGMFVAVGAAVAVGGLGGVGDKKAPAARRDWTRVATFVLVATLLVMMGRFTPVFGWLCVVFPWFFEFPHPIYYRFAECWALAVLAGVGVAALGEQRFVRAHGLRFVVAVAAVAACLAATALAWPSVWGDESLTGWASLTRAGEWEWFLGGPVLYLTAATAGLLALFTLLDERWRALALSAGILVEAFAVGYGGFYSGLLFEQKRKPPDYRVEYRDARYRVVTDHPHYELARELAERTLAEDVRFAGTVSTLDNQAWTHGNRALLGYSSKPMTPRMRDVTERFATGMPYDLHWSEAPKTYFSNMNVGYALAFEHEHDYDLEIVAESEHLTLYRVPDPLPHAYVQDRIVELERGTQADRLFESDLRQAAYVLPGHPNPTDLSAPPESLAVPISDEERGRFDDLQRDNPVTAIDRSRPNRLTIDVETIEPVMLVISEAWNLGWTATVDGHNEPVREVNFLQQGVWIQQPGPHRVVLSFFPTEFEAGTLLTLVSAATTLMGMLGGAVFLFVRRRASGNGES